MAREVTEVIRSDLSGNVISKADTVLLTFSYEDGRRNKWEMDISDAEAEELRAKGGREIKRRGRPRGSRNKPSS